MEAASEKLESFMKKGQQLCDLLDEWAQLDNDVETTETLSTEKIQQVGIIIYYGFVIYEHYSC